MEQETILTEILNVLHKHGEQMNEKFEQIDKRFEQIESRLDTMEQKIDRLDKKFDGLHVGLTETQENTNFLLSKVVQHEKKLHQINNQQ